MILGLLSYTGWMIEPLYASRMVPMIMRAMKNGTINQFFEQSRTKQKEAISAMYAGIEAEFAGESRDEPYWYTALAKNGKKVAIIPMLGAITKNGDACSFGMRDYQNIMARVAKNESISAALFHFNNTPGGTVDGTPEISHFIRNFPKPTVGFADGMVASAHYWMASQTRFIMANKLTETDVGSIGSFIPWENIQNMIDAGQLPALEIIRAPQSTNKARFNILEPLTDELRAELLEGLKETVKSFISEVKKGRGPALANDAEIFTGKMYSTDEAIANGLINSKGTLQDAINKAGQLAAAFKPSTSGPAKAKVNNSMKKFTKLSALLGAAVSLLIPGGAAEGNEVSLTEEQAAALEASEQKLIDADAAAAQLKTDNEAQTTRISELEATVAEQKTQITTLNSEKATLQTKVDTQAAELKLKPTGQATTIIPAKDKESNVSTDGTTVADDSEKFMTSADRAAAKIREQNATTQPKK